MPQCEYRKQDDVRCRANAMRGSAFCISHNPKAAGVKRAAVAKGGRNRRTPKRAARPVISQRVRSLKDLPKLLFQVLEDLRNGELDADLARSIGYLAGVAAKVAESVELERRVNEMEEVAMQMHAAYNE